MTAGSSATDPLQGLWSYRTVSFLGAGSIPTTGLFLFHASRFYQQAVSDGEPRDRQLGQAHIGRYQIRDNTVHFEVDCGLLTTPGAIPAFSVRRGGANHAQVSSDAAILTLRFDENTVQSLRRIQAGPTRIYAGEPGFLAIAGSRFLMATLTDANLQGANGMIEPCEGGFLLRASRWLKVTGQQVQYVEDFSAHVPVDADCVRLPSGQSVQLRE